MDKNEFMTYDDFMTLKSGNLKPTSSNMSQALTRAVPANPGLTKAVPAATSCCGSKAQKVLGNFASRNSYGYVKTVPGPKL